MALRVTIHKEHFHKKADEIFCISGYIQAELSGYSRTASGARASTLNTQLHPSGTFIIENFRMDGKRWLLDRNQ